MAQNQKYNERRVLSLPTTGLVAGDRYYLSVGNNKYQSHIVSDSLQLTKESGAEFIEVDTMAQMRALDARQIWALQNGYYKGVKLNGYYAEGDTPTPIEYLLTITDIEDNGGSVIEVSNNKLWHDFTGSVLHDSYFGFSTSVSLSDSENLLRLNAIYSSNAKEVQHSKNVIASVPNTINVVSNDMTIIGNGFTIRQADFSGMITTATQPLFKVTGKKVVVDNLIFDDNLENNYIVIGGKNVHWSSPGEFTGATRIGHDVVSAEEDDFVIRNCTIQGASWTGIKVQRRQTDLTRIKNPRVENNTIYNTARDAISALHVINPTIRGNQVYNSSHHAIHSYINNFNILIENNYIYNDVTEFFPWYTGIDFENYERGGIVLDHGNYPLKTKLTRVYNNVIEGKVLRDVKSGITTGGFPEDVEIDSNTTINCGNGIFVARGNPIGNGSKITNNIITNSTIGIAYWLADSGSGWQGGFTTPQQSKNLCAFNKIEALDTALRITGTQSQIPIWYSKYELIIENNIILGNPTTIFNQGINWPSGVDGNDYKVIYRNNTEINKGLITSAQTIVNTKRGDADIQIDDYYPVKNLNPDLIITSLVANSWYKLFSITMSSSSIVTGTIKLYDRRGVYNLAELDVFLRQQANYSMVLRSISLSNTTTGNNFVPSNFSLVIENNGGILTHHLYIRTSNTNRDITVDYSGLYFNTTVYNSMINFETNPVETPVLPSGENITVTNAVRLSYNSADYIQGSSANSASSQASSTQTEYPTVAEYNTLVDKYNTVATLVNELKTKLNQSLATEVASGQRRSS